jgi:hypothetical protein
MFLRDLCNSLGNLDHMPKEYLRGHKPDNRRYLKVMRGHLRY